TLRAYVVFFFFQAEDGIRDFHVTGVQTCALPISARIGPLSGPHPLFAGGTLGLRPGRGPSPDPGALPTGPSGGHRECGALAARRSEERRVGKEGRARWARKS